LVALLVARVVSTPSQTSAAEAITTKLANNKLKRPADETDRPCGIFTVANRTLIANVRKQRHEPSSLDRISHGVLADRGTTCLTSTNDFPVTVNQLLEQFHVFEIDVHWAWTLAIDIQRILLWTVRVVVLGFRRVIFRRILAKIKPCDCVVNRL